MRAPLSAMAAIALVAATSPAFAQDSNEAQSEHKGFHASVGLGAGWSYSRCAGCTTTQQIAGPTLTMRFGGALTPNVVMSAEYTAQARTSDITTAVALWGSLVVQWYPRARQGFFVDAGGGFALHNEDVLATESTAASTIEAVEWGYQFGVGYDIRRSRVVSITPFVEVLSAVGSPGKVNSQGAASPANVGAHMLHAGVALSWR